MAGCMLLMYTSITLCICTYSHCSEPRDKNQPNFCQSVVLESAFIILKQEFVGHHQSSMWGLILCTEQ